MDQICCLLGLCCPPSEQHLAVADAMMERGLSEADAHKVAEWFVAHVSADNMLRAIGQELAKHRKG